MWRWTILKLYGAVAKVKKKFKKTERSDRHETLGDGDADSFVVEFDPFPELVDDRIGAGPNGGATQNALKGNKVFYAKNRIGRGRFLVIRSIPEPIFRRSFR